MSGHGGAAGLLAVTVVTGDDPPAMIHPDARIGHVHLKVANLERAVAFYRDVLGFEVTASYGDQAAFLSAGGYHHHIGVNTWSSEGAPPPPLRSTGLYHFAILLPSRRELARTFKGLLDHGVPIEGAADHGVSEAIYFQDPDGNGIEIYADRDPADWPRRPDGALEMTTLPLDLDALPRTLDDPSGGQQAGGYRLR